MRPQACRSPCHFHVCQAGLALSKSTPWSGPASVNTTRLTRRSCGDARCGLTPRGVARSWEHAEERQEVMPGGAQMSGPSAAARTRGSELWAAWGWAHPALDGACAPPTRG